MRTVRTSPDMHSVIDRETEAQLWPAIDPEALETHLDAFEGLHRISGTDAEWEASEYVIDTLEGYGVSAHLHEYEALISVPETASLEIKSPDHFRFDDCITAAFSASTDPGGVHGQLTMVSEGDNPPSLDGEIAFLSGLPTPSVVKSVEEAGAVAAVFESPTEGHLHEMIVSPVWGTPSRRTAGDLPGLPVVQIQQHDADKLRSRLERGPVEANVRTQVTTDFHNLPCAVGEIAGKSDRYFLIGNHVDSWHEGITDNATAMAVSLELARLFAEEDLNRGIKFGFWSAHSTGRYAGSAWYADAYWNDLRRNAVGYLHLDLNGLQGADSFWYQHMAEVADEHLDALESVSDFELREAEDSFIGGEHRPGRNSDQSFWGVGASSLLSGARLEPDTDDGGPVGGGWWWHTPEDTRDKVDVDVMVEELKLYIALVSRFCHSPILPHDFKATVDDFRETLSKIDAESPMSFEEIRDRLDQLEAVLEQAQRMFDSRAMSVDGAQAVEELQADLGNLLVPTLYMASSDYEQEPALPQNRLPGLQIVRKLGEQSARQRQFTETTLQRERNRVVHRLGLATARVERFLDRFGQS